MFAVTSLVGAISLLIGGQILLALATAGVIALTALAYWRGREEAPGLTTEIALTVTVLLDGLSMQQPAIAGGLAVMVAIVLTAKSPIHRFVGDILREDELEDALIFAGATLIILPLVPDRPMGPYDALNPHKIWVIAILIMAISAAGYVAIRLLGARIGLPVSGLASGFVSSTATIASMGARAAKATEVIAAAVAGAALSTVATIVQMALVLATTSMATFMSLAIPLTCAGVAAAVYGTAFTVLALRQRTEAEVQRGRAFSLKTAFVLAVTLSIILIACAALQDRLGENGIILAAALAGFADTHSAAVSVASLVEPGKLSASDALLPILAGLSTNTISKIIVAATSGGLLFAARAIPGLIFVALAAWAGTFHGLLAG